MLKNKAWIVALLAALAMAFFGCIDPSIVLDDGSYVPPADDLVFEGKVLKYTAIGSSSSAVTFPKKGQVNIKGTTSAGFFIEFPEGIDDYEDFEVHFKILEITTGRPGLLMKKNTQLADIPGLTDQSQEYQLKDEDFNFKVGDEFTTSDRISGKVKGAQTFVSSIGPILKKSLFEGGIAFQHQAWNPSGNIDVDYTIEVVKMVFPGAKEATVKFDPDGGVAVKEIIVEQGREIGELPVTTKDGAIFGGWYYDTEEVTVDWEVPYEKAITLKAKWVVAKDTITKTATSLIHSFPASTYFTDEETGFTVNATGDAQFTIAGATASWNTVKFNYHDDLVYYNSVEPYSYNVAEFTVVSNVDYTFQLQAGGGGDIFKYPSNETPDSDNKVVLKAGVAAKFAVALSDTGAAAMRIQNTSNAAGNSTSTANITVVGVEFTKGTLHTVTFGANSPINFSGAREQKILDGKKVVKPADPTYTISGQVYDFIGWLLDGVAYDFGTKVTKDIDLTPKFANVIDRKVSFDLNGLKTIDGRDRVPPIVLSVTGDVNPTHADIVWPSIDPDSLPEGAIGYWWADGSTNYTGFAAPTTPLDGGEELKKDVILKAKFDFPFEIEGLGTYDKAQIIVNVTNGVGRPAVEPVNGGIMLSNGNWEWVIARFPITLTGGKTLGDLKSVKLKITEIAGGATSYKSYYLLAGNPLESNSSGQWGNTAFDISGAVATGNVAAGTAFEATFTVDEDKVTALSLTNATTFQIAIWASMGSAAIYTYTDWEFVWE